jgi:hypothetical protein
MYFQQQMIEAIWPTGPGDSILSLEMHADNANAGMSRQVSAPKYMLDMGLSTATYVYLL